MLTWGIKSFLIVVAAAGARWLFARATAPRARFDGTWRRLGHGRRHHALVACLWLITLFFAVVAVLDGPDTLAQSAFWVIIVVGATLFSAYCSYQFYLTRVQWTDHELRRFSWLFGWRFVLFRDLTRLDLLDSGNVVVATRWGEKLHFDGSFDGAPELVETCRRHIAANTAGAGGAAGFG